MSTTVGSLWLTSRIVTSCYKRLSVFGRKLHLFLLLPVSDDVADNAVEYLCSVLPVWLLVT